MKLALGLVFLINLQIIAAATSFWLPITYVGTQFETPVAIEYDNTGFDQNGNQFFEQNVIQTGFVPQTDMPVEYFPQELTPRDRETYLNSVGDFFDTAYKTEKLILNSPEQLPAIDPIMSAFSADSATNFGLPTTTFKMPGLGPFNLVKSEEETEPIEENKDFVKEKRKLEFILGLNKLEKPLAEKKTIEDESTDEDKFDLLNFEKKLQVKEREFLGQLNDKIRSEPLKLSHNKDYLYVVLAKKITPVEADDLLHYVSEISGFPFKWINEIRINDNLVMFKVDNIDLSVLCSVIDDHHDLVEAKLGYKILSCSVGNTGIKSLKVRYGRDRKNLFIVVVVVCVIVILTLIVLLSLFVIRRRAYLKKKLLENVTSISKKKQFDDVERLVTKESGSSFISKVWPFKTKEVNVQQADLCRSTKLSNSQVSPMNNTQTTDVSGRCDNFESTPIKTVDERKNTNRSSSSS